MKKPATDYFTPEMARHYDERNARLMPIAASMHFLIRLALQDLPAQARILCVGAGTGAELLALAQAYPQWRFVALDPAQAMLDLCRSKSEAAGVADRCEFVHGYIHDLPARGEFDAVVSVLVGHFIGREERPGFFGTAAAHLRTGGVFVNTEISTDLDASEFPDALRDWEKVQSLMGATPESLATLPKVLRETLTVLAPTEVEALYRENGFESPVQFYQAFLIRGWHGRKR